MQPAHFFGHVIPTKQPHRPSSELTLINGLFQEHAHITMTAIAVNLLEHGGNRLNSTFEHLGKVSVALRDHAG